LGIVNLNAANSGRFGTIPIRQANSPSNHERAFNFVGNVLIG
jgi:hypothetical protein